MKKQAYMKLMTSCSMNKKAGSYIPLLKAKLDEQIADALPGIQGKVVAGANWLGELIGNLTTPPQTKEEMSEAVKAGLSNVIPGVSHYQLRQARRGLSNMVKGDATQAAYLTMGKALAPNITKLLASLGAGLAKDTGLIDSAVESEINDNTANISLILQKLGPIFGLIVKRRTDLQQRNYLKSRWASAGNLLVPGIGDMNYHNSLKKAIQEY